MLSHFFPLYGYFVEIQTKAIRRFVITEKAPTRAFSWLKAATTAFTFKTLLRHYAKLALTPRSLNVKLGLQCKGHKGRAAIITNLRMELFEALPGAGHWLDKMKTGGASLSLVLIHFHLNFILGITQHKIIYIFLVLKIYLCIQTIWVEEWI